MIKIGDKVCDWEVVDFAPPYISPKGQEYARWQCRCICGKKKSVRESSLLDGDSKGCGCKRAANNALRLKTHGLSQHPLFGVWYGLINRCADTRRKDYKHYGGRGISVCDRWSGEDGCKNFIDDMYNSYSAGLEIERVDVNGNYEPSNCTWVTRREQVINRRPTGSSFDTKFIEFDSETLCLSQWADKTGIPCRVLIDRLGKLQWSVEKAFSTPCKTRGVLYKINGNVYETKDLLKNSPNVFLMAKKLGLTFQQFMANVLIGKAVVLAKYSKDVIEITPTKDMSDLFHKIKWKVSVECIANATE